MASAPTFIREHRTYCGEQYMTVDLFRYSEVQEGQLRKKRKRREKLSAPKQRNLNDKRARRYFMQLLNANFDGNDMELHLTYKTEPESKEAADKLVSNYLRRVAYRRKKLGLEPLKYILVTEGGDISQRTGKRIRLHHHLTLNGGIDRNDLELMWNTEKIHWNWLEQDKLYQGVPYREWLARHMIGYANTRKLQPGENGLEALARYLTKDPKGKKRWSASHNLKKPERVTRDHHFSCHGFQKSCTNGDIYSRAWWEKKYKGYTLAGCSELAVEAQPPDDEGLNDWRVFAKLRKIALKPKHKRPKEEFE